MHAIPRVQIKAKNALVSFLLSAVGQFAVSLKNLCANVIGDDFELNQQFVFTQVSKGTGSRSSGISLEISSGHRRNLQHSARFGIAGILLNFLSLF
jgi:hypothetical protein